MTTAATQHSAIPTTPGRVVGFGLINKDFVAVVPSWERDEKVNATAYFEQVGGPVPVALTAMARLGMEAPPVLLGVVGEDRDADDLAGLLRTDGVDASHLVRVPGPTTSRSLVLVDERDGSRTVANYSGGLPAMHFTAEHETFFSTARLLHLDGRELEGSLKAAEIVRGAGGIVSLDLGTMRPGREALMACCDIVLASRKGGAGAFPDAAQDPAEQVRRFLAMGVRIAGVTRAQEGLVIGMAQTGPVHLPAYRVDKPVDTCGAGDTFHGAFLWAFLQGWEPLVCADFAQAAAALRIQKRGNREGVPTHAAIKLFQEKVKKLYV